MIAFSANPFYCTTTKTCRPFLILQYPFWPFQYPYFEYASMDHSNCSSCISLWRHQLFVLLRSLSRITRGLVLSFSYNECVLVRVCRKFRHRESKLPNRSLDPRPRARPRSVGAFYSEEGPICPAIILSS